MRRFGGSSQCRPSELVQLMNFDIAKEQGRDNLLLLWQKEDKKLFEVGKRKGTLKSTNRLKEKNMGNTNEAAAQLVFQPKPTRDEHFSTC